MHKRSCKCFFMSLATPLVCSVPFVPDGALETAGGMSTARVSSHASPSPPPPGAPHLCTASTLAAGSQVGCAHRSRGGSLCSLPTGQSQYLMHPQLTSGPNALRFSPCALDAMEHVILQRRRQCFVDLRHHVLLQQPQGGNKEGLRLKAPRGSELLQGAPDAAWAWTERLLVSCIGSCGLGVSIHVTACQSEQGTEDPTGERCQEQSAAPDVFYRTEPCHSTPCPPCSNLHFSSPLRPELNGWLEYSEGVSLAYATDAWQHVSLDMVLMRLAETSSAHGTTAWTLLKLRPGLKEGSAERVSPVDMMGFVTVSTSAAASDLGGAWVVRDKHGRGTVSPLFFWCGEEDSASAMGATISVRMDD